MHSEFMSSITKMFTSVDFRGAHIISKRYSNHVEKLQRQMASNLGHQVHHNFSHFQDKKTSNDRVNISQKEAVPKAGVTKISCNS